MTTFGDFASLLQLGVGTGIGLSFFQAPIDLRTGWLSRRIENDLIVVDHVTKGVGVERRLALMTLKLELAARKIDVELAQRPPLVAALTGAFLNMVFLTWATVASAYELNEVQSILLIILTVAWFFAVLCWMEFIALEKIHPLINKYRSLQ